MPQIKIGEFTLKSPFSIQQHDISPGAYERDRSCTRYDGRVYIYRILGVFLQKKDRSGELRSKFLGRSPLARVGLSRYRTAISKTTTKSPCVRSASAPYSHRIRTLRASIPNAKMKKCLTRFRQMYFLAILSMLGILPVNFSVFYNYISFIIQA